MAVIENRVTELGDVLYIKAEVPIIGLIALTDFIDTVGGETVNRFFTKQFRYSKDGFNYFPWQLLTTLNVSTIQVSPSDTFIVEYRYIRSGSDTSDELSFTDVTLRGDFQSTSCGTAYQSSIFSQFFSCQDIEVLAWAINVLEKCYKRGIIPVYIERGSDFTQDRDYIDFWRTFTTFFAYIVVYARKLQSFSKTKELLYDYLVQKGLFLKPNSELDELTYLKENFYREISKRGTLSMLRKKGDQTVITKTLGTTEYIENGDFSEPSGGWLKGLDSTLITGLTGDIDLVDYSEDGIYQINLPLDPLKTYRFSFNILEADDLISLGIINITADIITDSNLIYENDSPTVGYYEFDFVGEFPVIFLLVNVFDTFRTLRIDNVSIREVISEITTTINHPVDGEMLRLICKESLDEFIFALVDSKNHGWNINNCSPLWRGNLSQKHINKAWEDTEDFVDISVYPIVGSTSILTDGSKKVLQLSSNVSSVNGIGVDYNNLVGADFSKAIIVSPYLNYRLHFQAREVDSPAANLTFGVICLDQNNNVISSKNIINNSSTNFFFQKKKLNKINTYYFIEGILYNFNQVSLPTVDGTCNIGYGSDLKFGNSTVRKILPFVLADNASSQFGTEKMSNGSLIGGTGAYSFPDGDAITFDTTGAGGMLFHSSIKSTAWVFTEIFSGITPGRTYRIAVTVGAVSGNCTLLFGRYPNASNPTMTITAPGTYYMDMVLSGANPPGYDAFELHFAGTSGTLFMASVSVKEVQISKFNIWDFKITPSDTPYSTGIVQGKNLIKMWYDNKNPGLDNDQVEDKIKHYMIPYSTQLKTVEIGE